MRLRLPRQRREFERDTRILLTPRTIRMDPDGSEEYDLIEDPLDLHRAFSKRSVRFHLRRRPVIEILRMRFAFSGITSYWTSPTSGCASITAWVPSKSLHTARLA